MRYLVFSDLLNKTFDTVEEAEAAEKAELDRIKKEEDKKKAEESVKAELKKKIENSYLELEKIRAEAEQSRIKYNKLILDKKSECVALQNDYTNKYGSLSINLKSNNGDVTCKVDEVKKSSASDEFKYLLNRLGF